ncbi:bile acid:sodium symporter family protein [Flavilitoribacter nigricans]|uniref:Bile acid:sodium symporter n=1 Tax=Flavilitoribacter nigricans (strain ATCC 23147 / DSM 23189 / NBRC 102662 / NCIMB 1420 / SS-2) TaxID=1122177 RepID=A0A2D0N852_FLAN2|nr:bile acid:sodium symporter family protein [Flavilitoribacter nigricans]PHN04694.1 bile acid:sodium symporter [Flavilitoribacter nigricans DSM 23189 = NBRC 102662]
MNLVDILIGGILAFIMFSVGLSLTWRNFVVTFARPRAYLGGLFLQIIVLPTLAFTIATLADLPPAFKVGIMILSTCPGGTTSNFVTYLLNANTALSISLTVTNSFLALITVPLIVSFSVNYFMGSQADISLPIGQTIQQILSVILAPTFAGLLVRRYFPNFAVSTQRPLKWITVILLAILFIIKFFAGEDQGGTGITLSDIRQIIPYSFVGNFLNLMAGFGLATLLRLGTNDKLTMGVEVGIQNTSLAFLIGGTLLGNEDTLKPALVYAMFTFFTALIYGLIVKPEEWKAFKKLFLFWKKAPVETKEENERTTVDG